MTGLKDTGPVVLAADFRHRCEGCGVEEAEYHRPRCPRLLEAVRGPLTCESCFAAADALYGVSKAASGVDRVCANCFAWRWRGRWDATPAPLAEVEANPAILAPATWRTIPKPPIGSV